MKKEFYIGQPLIIKETGEKVTSICYDPYGSLSYSVLMKERHKSFISHYVYDELEPSTEFKFSELMAGLEQGYFEVGTKFRRLSNGNVLTVAQSYGGLYLSGGIGLPSLTSTHVNSTWELVGDGKEMTLEEIEEELGYKIKLIENSEETMSIGYKGLTIDYQ